MLEIGGSQLHGNYAVFDVDETLGYFAQFGAFVDALNNYYSDFSRVVFDNFNELLDLYPEFIRPNMIEILKYFQPMNEDLDYLCILLFLYKRLHSFFQKHILEFQSYLDE